MSILVRVARQFLVAQGIAEWLGGALVAGWTTLEDV
jgi:hypothetical protein